MPVIAQPKDEGLTVLALEAATTLACISAGAEEGAVGVSERLDNLRAGRR